MSQPNAMKPMVIIPVGSMNKEDIQRLNDNGLCVVESKDPMALKFLDPLPVVSSRSQIEHAAIQLSRKLLNWPFRDSNTCSRFDIQRLFCELLSKGTPLDSEPTLQEREQSLFNVEKVAEICRLAKEEARAERAVRKQQLAKKG